MQACADVRATLTWNWRDRGFWSAGPHPKHWEVGPPSNDFGGTVPVQRLNDVIARHPDVLVGSYSVGSHREGFLVAAVEKGAEPGAWAGLLQEAGSPMRVRVEESWTTVEELLGSNTSSIPVARLAAATSRPESVIGLHFFNPSPILPIVEVVPSRFTSPAVRERAEGFVGGALGMRIIRAPDRAGFVLNAMLVPFLLSAVRMLEGGIATADDIDAAMVVGCGHPMGPLALADFIGLDTVTGIANSLHAASSEALHAPPALLVRMASEGKLGRRTGEGFHRYTS